MFANRLKKLRKKVGLTQIEFAEKLGVSKGTVAMWEAGRREPGYKNINRLSEMFNNRMDYLLGFSDDLLSLADGDETAKFSRRKTQFPQIIEKLMECHPVSGDKISKNDLAKIIGVKAKMIDQYILGNAQPNPFYLMKMAEYFSVSTDYLITGKMFNGREGERATGPREAELDTLIRLLSLSLLNNESVQTALQAIAAAGKDNQANEGRVRKIGNQQIQCGGLS